MDERAADAMWQVPKSRVFEESYAQFSEPMLLSAAAAAGVGADVSTAASVLVPSMSEIRHTKWRHARNQAVQSHARELIRAPSIKSSYVEVGYLNAEWEATSCLRFHPYETLLFAADNKSGIGVFNYSPDSASGASGGAERLNTFSNDNPPGTRVTQLELVNELAVSLLMVASDDGVVRVWRGAHEEGRQSLVTAWVANPQPEPFYSATAPAASNTTVPNTPASSTATVVDSYGVPSHGGEVPMSMAHTPAARLAGRAHTGVGMPPPPSSPGSGNIAMRHSVSTPAMALSANGATPAASTRNDSISRNGSALTQPNSYLSVPHAQTQRSPSLSGASSPALSGQAVSGAMNIPNLSLGGSANNTTGQQRVSPAQSFSGGWSSLSSRRKQKPPMTIEWQQQRGRLLASGNGLDSMRIWNVEQELCVSDIPLIGHEHSELSPAHATSIASDGGDIVWVGCADGSVRCFDLRLSPLESLVSSALLHRTPVHSVRLQRGGTDGGKLISASVGGDIALADVRASLAAVNTQEEAASASVVRFHRGSHKDKTSLLSAFAVHDYAPIMASGSPKPFIEVFAHDGATLNVMRHHIGFLGARVAPVSSLTFHRHHLVLAAGGADGTITLYDGGGGMGSGTQR
jgi:WD40 repeat protein